MDEPPNYEPMNMSEDHIQLARMAGRRFAQTTEQQPIAVGEAETAVKAAIGSMSLDAVEGRELRALAFEYKDAADRQWGTGPTPPTT